MIKVPYTFKVYFVWFSTFFERKGKIWAHLPHAPLNSSKHSPEQSKTWWSYCWFINIFWYTQPHRSVDSFSGRELHADHFEEGHLTTSVHSFLLKNSVQIFSIIFQLHTWYSTYFHFLLLLFLFYKYDRLNKIDANIFEFNLNFKQFINWLFYSGSVGYCINDHLLFPKMDGYENFLLEI